jgi:hypothetical protein
MRIPCRMNQTAQTAQAAQGIPSMAIVQSDLRTLDDVSDGQTLTVSNRHLCESHLRYQGSVYRGLMQSVFLECTAASNTCHSFTAGLSCNQVYSNKYVNRSIITAYHEVLCQQMKRTLEIFLSHRLVSITHHLHVAFEVRSGIVLVQLCVRFIQRSTGGR